MFLHLSFRSTCVRARKSSARRRARRGPSGPCPHFLRVAADRPAPWRAPRISSACGAPSRSAESHAPKFAAPRRGEALEGRLRAERRRWRPKGRAPAPRPRRSRRFRWRGWRTRPRGGGGDAEVERVPVDDARAREEGAAVDELLDADDGAHRSGGSRTRSADEASSQGVRRAVGRLHDDAAAPATESARSRAPPRPPSDERRCLLGGCEASSVEEESESSDERPRATAAAAAPSRVRARPGGIFPSSVRRQGHGDPSLQRQRRASAVTPAGAAGFFLRRAPRVLASSDGRGRRFPRFRCLKSCARDSFETGAPPPSFKHPAVSREFAASGAAGIHAFSAGFLHAPAAGLASSPARPSGTSPSSWPARPSADARGAKEDGGERISSHDLHTRPRGAFVVAASSSSSDRSRGFVVADARLLLHRRLKNPPRLGLRRSCTADEHRQG